MTYTPRAKKPFIDFDTLSPKELIELSDKWEQEAMKLEMKLDNYMSGRYTEPTPEETKAKIERLWVSGKAAWARVALLDNWRKRKPRNLIFNLKRT